MRPDFTRDVYAQELYSHEGAAVADMFVETTNLATSPVMRVQQVKRELKARLLALLKQENYYSFNEALNSTVTRWRSVYDVSWSGRAALTPIPVASSE